MDLFGFAVGPVNASERKKLSAEEKTRVGDGDQSAAASASDIQDLNNRLNNLERGSVLLSIEHNYLDIGTSKGDVVLKIRGGRAGGLPVLFRPRNNL